MSLSSSGSDAAAAPFSSSPSPSSVEWGTFPNALLSLCQRVVPVADIPAVRRVNGHWRRINLLPAAWSAEQGVLLGATWYAAYRTGGEEGRTRAVAAIAPLRNINILDRTVLAGGDAVRHVMSSCRALQRVRLSWWHVRHMTPELVRICWPHLLSLRLFSPTQVSALDGVLFDSLLACLVVLPPSLQKLRLLRMTRLTLDELFLALAGAAYAPSLRLLEVSRWSSPSPSLTAAGLTALASFTSLTSLQLNKGDSLTGGAELLEQLVCDALPAGLLHLALPSAEVDYSPRALTAVARRAVRSLHTLRFPELEPNARTHVVERFFPAALAEWEALTAEVAAAASTPLSEAELAARALPPLRELNLSVRAEPATLDIYSRVFPATSWYWDSFGVVNEATFCCLGRLRPPNRTMRSLIIEYFPVWQVNTPEHVPVETAWLDYLRPFADTLEQLHVCNLIFSDGGLLRLAAVLPRLTSLTLYDCIFVRADLEEAVAAWPRPLRIVGADEEEEEQEQPPLPGAAAAAPLAPRARTARHFTGNVLVSPVKGDA